MQSKIIFPALMLCLGMLNACGATRPSKFYELTAASDRASGADPSPYSANSAAWADHIFALVSRRPHRLHIQWSGDGHVRISEVG
jgi:hypothetical protein